MGDVFISYARTDQPIARRVAKALTDRGFQVWWDDQLPAHKAYSEIIEQRLRDAKAVVVLWSAAAASSQWVRAEADYARNANKLVQAQVDDGIPPMPFNQIQCADLKNWRGSGKHQGWSKLAASVEALVSGTEPAETPFTSAPGWRDRLNLRWLAVAAVGLVIAAVAAFYLLAEKPEAKRPILAVLPFQSLDQRDASLVSGIWEDTRQALSRNPQLLVLGPHTSEQLAEGKPAAARKAADYLVEASVRAIGDRVRVSANLTRTEDGSQMWSENFDRRLDNVFQLQSEIAREIEGRIRGRLASGGGVQPENIATSGEVYALYSDARAKVRARKTQYYDDAFKQMQRVVQMDPNFAPGWATLAVMKTFGFIQATTDSTTAEANARRAIALAPNLAAGHAALGLVLRDPPAKRAALRRALQLDPNDIEAMNWMANSLEDSESSERLKLYSRIAELEPLWWPAIFNKLDLLADMGKLDAIEQELKRVERLGDTRLITAVKMDLYTRRGDLSAAINTGLDFMRRTKGADRDFIGGFVWAPLFQLGYFHIADQVSPPPPFKFIPFLRTGDVRALDMVEAEVPPAAFWSRTPLPFIAGRIYLYHDQGPRLARRYRAVASNVEEFEQTVSPGVVPLLAPIVAMALISDGDQAEADRLLARGDALVASQRVNSESQIWRARIRAVQGRKDEAIALLSSAIRDGWLPTFNPIHTDIALDPPLALLAPDPRFAALRQQINGHFAKERAELGEIRLN